MDRVAYSPTEAAEALGISRSAAYNLIGSGRLRAVRLGRRTLVPRDALGELLDGLDRASHP